MATRRRIEVLPYGSDGQSWYWRELGGNGRVVCVAEGFASKWNATHAAKRQAARYRIPPAVKVVSKVRDSV